MPVKYWSAAGLMITNWCNARCASCYLNCHPGRSGDMSVEEGVRLWRELIDASPHGCRVHVTGGEPFGRWPLLIEILRQARREGSGPLQKVETNGYWASDEATIRDRLAALDEAGMETLGIAADPYHQQFVPIEMVRRLARLAAEQLGADRVDVRWQDWLAEGVDTDAMDSAARMSLFERYASGGRDRMNGRAAVQLAPRVVGQPAEAFAGRPCREALLRSKHVHLAPGGWIVPGTCAGMVLGRAAEGVSVGDRWRQLDADHVSRPIVGALAEHGPVGLLDMARAAGFDEAPTYAGKCHLCWSLRAHLFARGLHPDEIAPADSYEHAVGPFDA
jgi:hypothetical protein